MARVATGSAIRSAIRAIRGLALAGALFGALAMGCGKPGTRPLRPGESPPGKAVGLAHAADAARGALTYAVAFAGDDILVTVELELTFALVVRRIEPSGVVELRRVPLGDADYDVEDLAIDPGGTTAWVASRDGTVRAIDLTTGRVSVTWHLGSSGTAVAVSPDRRWVATGTADGVLCLRRIRDGALLQCLAAHQSQISSLDFDSSGNFLASASWDGRVSEWRVPALSFVARQTIRGSANDVAFSPSGRRLAIAASVGPPIRSPEVARRESTGDIAVSDPRNAIYLWTPGTQLRALRGHRGPVTGVAWTPDGTRVLSSSWDRTVRMWDTAAQTAKGRGGEPGDIARLAGFSSLVRDVAIDRRSRLVAVGSWTRTLEGRSSSLVYLMYRSVRAPALP